MSLRTYPLIVHPAFLHFIEGGKDDSFLDQVDPNGLCPTLPRLEKAYDIAKFLAVDPLLIRSLTKNKEKHYRYFEIEKKSGGVREIHAPRTFLKVIQWWILDTILSIQPVHESAYGFTKGKGFVDNARRHVGAKYLLNVDIENFFPSVSQHGVFLLFRQIGYNDNVAEMLAEICCYGGSLPQGAPTSPAISTLILTGADDRICALSLSYGISTYTRYADDLSFSSGERISEEFISALAGILAEYGLRLNSKKTRFMGPNITKDVTGIILGQDGVALSRRFLNKCRGWFHTIRKQPEQYLTKVDKVSGTVRLIEQVGGRGSHKVAVSGREALASIRAVTPPPLEAANDDPF